MVASGSRTMIAGSLSSYIAGFHQSCRFSRSSSPRRSCVCTGRLSLLLALEIAPTGRATGDRHRAARVDPTDERRKSALGRADRVPNKNAHFRSCALTQAGSPDPRNDRICITSSCPRQLVLPIYLPVRVMPTTTISAPCISRPGP